MNRQILPAILCVVATVCNATTYYVSTTGNDENDGLSLGTAFSSLAKAVDAAGAEEAEILIAPGEYSQTAAIRVEAPLSIRGTGAAATNVVLKNTTSGQHVITIAHADAELALVTLTGGSAKEGPVCLGIEAGTVRDCRVTGCSYTLNRGKTGGTVVMSGGRIMRSVIDGNAITATSWDEVYSAGVYATAGVVENCLIKGNSVNVYNSANSVEASALNLAGTSRAVNCTIVGNTARWRDSSRKPMTTYAAANAKIVNCVIFGNICDDPARTVWAGTAASYVNCFSEEAINSTCTAILYPGFADPDNGDYTPVYASPLKDAGSNSDYSTDAVSATDIKGDTRVLNGTIDVGAYEYVLGTGLVVDFSYTVNRRLLPASVTFTALPENVTGPVTYRWDFDSDGIIDRQTSEATITVDLDVAKTYDVTLEAVCGTDEATAYKPRVVKAIQRDVYVATDGSNAYPYATPATAAATIHTAVEAADTGCIIHVLPGTYTQSAPFALDKAVTVTSTTTNAADVILRNTSSGKCVATVSHEGAELAGVTLTGGSAGSGPACLGIEAGVVRDCRVTGCSYGMGRTVTGGTVLMSGGRLMRSVIDGNTITGTGWNSVFAAGVCASAGVVENCLIKGNSAHCYNDMGGIETSALNLSGTAQAANCTIVDNVATMNGQDRKPMTTYAASGAKIVNCVIFGNTCVVADYTVWAGTAANYVNCVSDSATAINATCSTTVDPGFAAPVSGDYTPTYASPLRDVGSNADYAAAAVSETDLKGDGRILNDTIDVGAFEYVPSAGLTVDFSCTVNRRLLPASVTFSVVIGNASGSVTYKWDFDSDGTVDLVTQEATVTNEYSAAGIYDVSLTAVSGAETATILKQEVVRAIQRDVYVSLEGSAVYPYATPATAATSVHAAVAEAADGCVVHVLPGTYAQSAPFTIDKAVTVVSSTTNAEDVILRNTASNQRVVEVADEGAELAGVTLTGGSASKLGGALTLTAGLVRDCTLTGNGVGGCRDSDGRSGMVCMSGGRLVRCRLVGNDGGISWNGDCAGGVNASGGVVDTCLVATNRMSYWGGAYTAALGVKLTGDARAVNCTIVDNVCKNPGRQSNGNGAYPMATHASSNARFVNCLIWGNVTEEGDTQNYVWHGTATSYVNCYSELTINETSPAVEDPGLVDIANGNYALAKNSPLVNKGVDYASAGGESEFDLSGVQNRIVGSRIDIGCYEASSSAFIIIVR